MFNYPVNTCSTALSIFSIRVYLQIRKCVYAKGLYFGTRIAAPTPHWQGVESHQWGYAQGKIVLPFILSLLSAQVFNHSVGVSKKTG